MNKIIGIYKIQSIEHSDRFYIGSSINITTRWKNHLNKLKLGKHNPKIQNHYNKYGEHDLQFSILCECEKDDLLKIEQSYIDSLNPFFNCCPTAGNSIGRIPWNKGLKGVQIVTEETRNKHRIKQSEECKQKKREASLRNGNIPPSAKGLKRSELTKQKMSKALMGKKCSLGHRHSGETKKKMSDARKLYYENKRVKQLENK